MTDRSFKALRKNTEKDYSGFPSVKLAILSDTATQYLTQTLKAVAYEKRLDPEIYEAGFDRIDSESIDTDSGLYKSRPDYVILLQSSENLCRRYYSEGAAGRENFGREEAERQLTAADRIYDNSKAEVLVCNYCEFDDGVFGNLAATYDAAFPHVIRDINRLLADGVKKRAGSYLVDIDSAQNEYGRALSYDPRMYYLSSNPFSMDFLVRISEKILSVIAAFKNGVKKCLITDLDDTLWGGLVGELGLSGITVGDLGIGKAFSDYQLWLRELSRRGITICVCSKNEEDTAKEVFDTHPDMKLKLDDIAVFKANWSDKAGNIRDIQKILNIGLDSMVFIDDNPAERDLVRTMLPEITVPEIPADPVFRLVYLQSLGLFETPVVSEEDIKRSDRYREEGIRSAAKDKAISLEDYLAGLDMRCMVRAFDEYSVPRIAQLTQRTNQFNLRTIRYTEAEIKAIAESPEYITMSLSLRDSIGDYGIIAAVILKKESKETLFLDSFLMSCRVAKRGVEEYIFNHIVSVAKEQGYSQIVGEYIPSGKNAPVSGLLENMGFRRDGDQKKMNISDYRPAESFVNEE